MSLGDFSIHLPSHTVEPQIYGSRTCNSQDIRCNKINLQENWN